MLRDLVLRQPFRTVWGFPIGIILLLSACGTTLRVLDAERARAHLPFLVGQLTKGALLEKLARASPRYEDPSGRILVYGMASEEPDGLLLRSVNDEDAPYELVLVFNEDDRLKRYSLIKIK